MMALAKRALEWEEKYTREGFEEGLKQGLERGEKRGIEQGIGQGRRQGLKQCLAAERELLRRQAARKFGAAAGDALTRHLAGISHPDRLAGVGERIVDCGTVADLLKWLDAERDGAWKRLFGLPDPVEHLIEGFASPETGRLDFSTLRQQPTNSVDADGKQRHGGAAWRVDYGDGSGRSLVWLIEFPSRVDPSMAARMRGYADAVRERLIRQGETDADGEVRVLPAVLYSGDGPWNALGGVAEVSVTAEGELSLPVGGNYLLLDANRRARKHLPRDNLVAAVSQLNASETLDELRARVRPLLDPLRGESRRAVFDWLCLAAPRMIPQSDAAAVVESLKRELAKIETWEGTMMALADRIEGCEAEWRREGFEKGLKQGLERGEKRGVERGIERGRAQVLELGIAAERALLCRQAVRQFGAADADALVRHLAGISDPDGLARVGERIVDCGTGAELLDWLDAGRDGADAR